MIDYGIEKNFNLVGGHKCDGSVRLSVMMKYVARTCISVNLKI